MHWDGLCGETRHVSYICFEVVAQFQITRIEKKKEGGVGGWGGGG